MCEVKGEQSFMKLQIWRLANTCVIFKLEWKTKADVVKHTKGLINLSNVQNILDIDQNQELKYTHKLQAIRA